MRTAFAFVTDERGFDLAMHSAASVALTQKRPSDIHVFCHQFDPPQASRLSSAFARVDSRLAFQHIQDEAVEHHKTHGHVTTPTLLKLSAIDCLIEGYDRVAYLDNDVLVFERLPIETINFGSAPLAAVVDMDVSDLGVHRDLHSDQPVSAGSICQGYFNAGVLIFECEKLADGYYTQRYRAALEEHRRKCTFKLNCTSIDQCALNIAFDERWISLPLSYNMQAGAKYTEAWRSALVRHYCGTRKFMPVSWFRNDARDVLLLNRVRRLLGRPAVGMPTLHELLFRLNIARKYRDDLTMRRFLRAVEASGLATV